MTSKVAIVTGANSGIGYEVTRVLCEKGNDVILACRSEERANRAIEKLKRQVPNAVATYMQLDLASLESVRKFVDEFHSTEKKLSILINNAGLSLGNKDTKRQYTKDNFELAMGTNHLGHFLLTNLLLNDLKKTAAEEGADVRIVVVASFIHDPELTKKRTANIQPLDFDNFFLFNDGTYSGLQAYKNSKLANVMFAYELCRQLDGTGVKVNAICPGFVPTTEIMRSASSAQKFYCRYILHGMLRFTKATRTVQQAANAIVSLALDEKFKDVTGKYFRDGQESKSSEESMDEEKQKKLWELSGGYTHLEGFEPIEVPPPPVAEEKTEKPAETVDANGEAAKTGEENKTEESKPEGEGKAEETKEKECEEKAEEPKEGEEKKEVEEKTEEEKKDVEEKKDIEEKKVVEEKNEVEEKKEVEAKVEEKESEDTKENEKAEGTETDKIAATDEKKVEKVSETPAENKPVSE